MASSPAILPPAKKIKVTAASSSDPFSLLTDDFLIEGPIFAFLGNAEYFYLAPVCKQFRDTYSAFQEKVWTKKIQNEFPESYEDKLARMGTTKLTSFSAASSSLERAKEFLQKTEDFNADDWVQHHLILSDLNRDYVLSPECPFYWLRNAAVRDNHLEVLKWLMGIQWKNFFGYEGTDHSTTLTKLAAKHGSLSILQWARRHGYAWDAGTCSIAAENGHLETLQWARHNGCQWDAGTCSIAAHNGHLEILQWARHNGCQWDKLTCEVAARNGNLEVLQWARQEGCPWDEITCVVAAHNGHLELLQWARQNGCPWNERTCEVAAANGQLEVLQWARQNGCPWGKWTCYSAAEQNGHLAVLQWARQNGCEEFAEFAEPYIRYYY